MVDFSDRVEKGFGALGDLAPLALVPVALSLLDVDKIRSVLAFEGFHVGLKIGIPAPGADLWSLVDPPDTDAVTGTTYHWTAAADGAAGANGSAASESFALVAGVALVTLLVEAVLVAGYLGSIRGYLATGSYGFAANVGRYVGRMVGLYLLAFGAFLAMLPLALAAPVLILLAIPVALALFYLLWAAPYLIVVRDCSVRDALVGSYRLAAAGGPYLAFTLTYLLAVLVASIPASLIVANGGAVGLAVGLVAVGPVGMALNVAVVDFVIDLATERADLLPDSTASRDGSVRSAGGFEP